jgi:hypothetical protein
MLYVMSNRKVFEVNTSNGSYRISPFSFPARANISYTSSYLLAAAGSQLYRVNLSSLDVTQVSSPGGTVHGIASFGSKFYAYIGSCYYEIDASTMASTTISC